MRSRLMSYFFFTLMLIKVCIMPLIYLDFELRHDYIVKNFCINKNRPQLNCDGKCYLAKRIAAAKEKEEREAERNFVYQLCETIAEPIRPVFAFGKCDTAETQVTVSFDYLPNLKGRILTSGVFHPPLTA